MRRWLKAVWEWFQMPAESNVEPQNRWTLMFHGDSRKYILTEQWLIRDDSINGDLVWGYRTQTYWDTLKEALTHIEQTNERRLKERT